MLLVGISYVSSPIQLTATLIFLPLLVYFGFLITPKRSKALTIQKISTVPAIKKSKKKGSGSDEVELLEADVIPENRKFDLDRRAFLKLIGSAGLSVFMFSIFTKRAHAAFFGSAPGPGTVALKDSGGNLIDPAIKQPTDGYRIAELDDTSDPSNSYYGFVNKDGDWFILREASDGEYKYFKKLITNGSFSSEWVNRGGFTYQYFDAIFD